VAGGLEASREAHRGRLIVRHRDSTGSTEGAWHLGSVSTTRAHRLARRSSGDRGGPQRARRSCGDRRGDVRRPSIPRPATTASLGPRAASDPWLIQAEFPELVQVRGGGSVPPRTRRVPPGFPKDSATVKANKEFERDFQRALDDVVEKGTRWGPETAERSALWQRDNRGGGPQSVELDRWRLVEEDVGRRVQEVLEAALLRPYGALLIRLLESYSRRALKRHRAAIARIRPTNMS
jgi:hypothetical protein